MTLIYQFDKEFSGDNGLIDTCLITTTSLIVRARAYIKLTKNNLALFFIIAGNIYWFNYC